MNSIFDIFKIGIGPSSSHTMGPVVACKKIIDRVIQNKLLDKVKLIEVELFGSLAYTGKAHGTDKALIAGLCGSTPDIVSSENMKDLYQKTVRDGKIKIGESILIPFDLNKNIIYNTRDVPSYHSNALLVSIYTHNRKLLLKEKYYSVGGGTVISENKIETSPSYIDYPYKYKTATELLNLCAKENLNIWDIVLINEKHSMSDDEIESGIKKIWTVMNESINKGINTEGVLDGGLRVERRASGLFSQLRSDQSNDSLKELDYVNAYAIAVNEENSSGGRIVTAPTNGASGVVPSVIRYASEFTNGFDDESLKRFFLTAGAIGGLYKLNASISGAEVGCQGEVGVACSMAAGGLVAALKGTNRQVENAAEIAMEHNLGLTCDPINGLVQIPCIERNAMGAVKSINAARLALKSNQKSKVSLDQVIKTMYDTGKDMQSNYKETSKGGLAVNVVEC